MLVDAIVLGSRLFHSETKWNDPYDRYRRDRDAAKWLSPESLDEPEVQRLVRFLGEWSTHYQAPVSQLLVALRAVLPELLPLSRAHLLTVELTSASGMSTTNATTIEKSFDAIARCHRRNYESVAASKMLHMFNPDLFVIWDSTMATVYGFPDRPRTGRDYATRYLPYMQRLSRVAIGQMTERHGISSEEALKRICACGHSLPKVLDEYNYMRYVAGRPDLLEEEQLQH